MSDDLKDAIETNAQAPKRMKEKGLEAEQHSLKDQIAAYNFLKGEEATATGAHPVKLFRWAKVIPPGAR